MSKASKKAKRAKQADIFEQAREAARKATVEAVTGKAPAKRTLYFAYGSNMSKAQMKQRCPAAKAIGQARLYGWELEFRSNWKGNGVANICPAQMNKDVAVHGALWELTPKCERALDRYEGYPHLYTKGYIEVVRADGQKVEALVYVMNLNYQRTDPGPGYLAGIIAGMDDFGYDLSLAGAALCKATGEKKVSGTPTFREVKRKPVKRAPFKFSDESYEPLYPDDEWLDFYEQAEKRQEEREERHMQDLLREADEEEWPVRTAWEAS